MYGLVTRLSSLTHLVVHEVVQCASRQDVPGCVLWGEYRRVGFVEETFQSYRLDTTQQDMKVDIIII